MDQAMNVNDWYLFHDVGNVIIFQRVIGPRLMGLAPDEAVIAAAMPKAHAVFDELARLLGEQDFFAGDKLSLADLMLAPAVEFFNATPEWAALGAPHPNLAGWLARMAARPSFEATTWERLAGMAQAA
jgi:glutathione S-transferase